MGKKKVQNFAGKKERTTLKVINTIAKLQDEYPDEWETIINPMFKRLTQLG